MNTTNNQVEMLRKELERALRQNECEMLMTGDEIRAARKVLKQTERAATQPAGDLEARIRAALKDTHIEDGTTQMLDLVVADLVAAIQPAPVQAAPDAKQQGILLVGLQALCVSADQEWTRQGGKLSEFDKGWFMGQLQSIDFYTPAEKEAVYKCREYIEKLSAAPVLSLYELQRNAAEGAISSEFESMFGAAPTAPERTSEAGELVALPVGLIASACYVIRKTGEHDSLLAKLRAYTTGEFARQSPPTVTGSIGDDAEFKQLLYAYGGVIHRGDTTARMDAARDAIVKHIDARSPVAAAPTVPSIWRGDDTESKSFDRWHKQNRQHDRQAAYAGWKGHANRTYTAFLRDYKHGTPAAAPESAEPSAAARDVLAERQRQISVEGWMPERDDAYTEAELPRAAGCYALFGRNQNAHAIWPWAVDWWKPRGLRHNYVRAAALLVAEIERLDRATSSAAKGANNG